MPIKGGIFSGENSKIFQNFAKILKTIQNTKIVQNFVKELCLVVGVGQWSIHGQYSFLFIQYYVYTYTIYIKYTYFMHIFWCFMHKHCILSTIHRAILLRNSMRKIDFQQNLIYTPHFLYIEPTYTSVYISGLFGTIYSFSLHTNFWLKTQKKNTPFLVCSLCVQCESTLLYTSPVTFFT